jgi:hypothetical protein
MEERQFKMDPGLLYSVITRQAGSIEKAWLEAVQNSIDAKSTGMLFSITDSGFQITDNGIGMSKEEILNYFEVFGKSAKDADDLGEFGMGRGQIFAMGKTSWYTGTFKMIVDIKNKGLTYELVENLPRASGTSIFVETYEKIKLLSNRIKRFKEWIKYVEIPITINSDVVNEKFMPTFEDDNAKYIISMDDDKLVVYNRGIFVKEEYKGVGVIVVSKKNLKVNFARNDIIYDCPIYAKILEKIDKFLVNKFEEATYLTDDNKKAVVELITNIPEAREKLGDKPVFKGGERFYSFNHIKDSGSYAVAFRAKPTITDKLQQAGYVILNKALPEELGFGLIKRTFTEIFQESGIKDDSTVISKNDMSETEEERFAEVERFVRALKSDRKLKLGKSSLSAAWTDGRSYIVINKDFLNKDDYRDLLWEKIVHELTHDDDSEKTNLHGEQFDLRFRELIENEKHQKTISDFIRGELN